MVASIYKITGTLSDYHGNRLAGGDIRLKADKFKDIIVTTTDDDGHFELLSSEQKYLAYACKNYKIDFLEFWFWDLTVDQDTKEGGMG